MVSTKVPAISNTRLISSSKAIGSVVNPSRLPARRAGMSSMAAIQLKADAVEDGLSQWVKSESTPMKAWMSPLPRVFKEEALKHFPQEIVINWV